jgi:hypothetical protein
MVSTLKYGRLPSRFLQDQSLAIIRAEQKAKRGPTPKSPLSTTTNPTLEWGAQTCCIDIGVLEQKARECGALVTCPAGTGVRVNWAAWKRWYESPGNALLCRRLSRDVRNAASADAIKVASEVKSNEDILIAANIEANAGWRAKLNRPDPRLEE